MKVEAKNLPAPAGGRWPLVATIRHLLATNALLRHNVLLLASTVITGIFSYLFHPVVGRLLGSAQYGVVLSVSSLFGILLMPTSILATVFNKFTADFTAQGRPDQVNYLLRRATRYGLLIGIVFTGILVALSPTLAAFLKLSSPWPIIVSSIGVVLVIPSTVTNGAIQGRQEFGWLGVLSFISVVLRVVLTAGLILVGLGIYGAFWGLALTGIIGYLLTLWPLRHVLRGAQAPMPSLKPLFSYSLTSALSAVGAGLLVNTDTLLAKHYLTQTEAGYYAALVTIGRIVIFVSASCSGVMFPKVTALQKQGGNYRSILMWTLAGSFCLSASVVVVFWLFPAQLVSLIFHAPSQVTRQLVWYGIAMLMFSLANVLLTYFLSLGQRAFVFIQLGCGVLEAGLITVSHGNAGQIVADVVITMAALLFATAALLAGQIRTHATRSATPESGL